jgi:hypothetical protein
VLKFRHVMHATSVQTQEVGDVDGHVLGLSHYSGLASSTMCVSLGSGFGGSTGSRGGVATFRLISATSGWNVQPPQWCSPQRRHFGAFIDCSPVKLSSAPVKQWRDDIYGDGVNIAVRLEGLAAPGGICLTANTWRCARGRIAARVVDLGEQRLKNVADPVHVFAIARQMDVAQAPGPAG